MEAQQTRINRRKILTGIVVSIKMQKTITVDVETKTRHPLYKKLVIRHKKYHVHDENDVAKCGDKVEIIETRPISKTKSFRLNKVVEKAK